MNEEHIVTCVHDGIPVSIDTSQLADMDTLELFYELQQDLAEFEDGAQLVTAIGHIADFAKRIYGPEQWRNIKRSLRRSNGTADVQDCITFIFGSLEAAANNEGAELKN